MGKAKSGEGSTRLLSNGNWECIVQSKYINPDSKTGAPKRIKRSGKTEEEARKNAKLDLKAWEKAYEKDKAQNLKLSKTKTFGQYMEEFIDNEVKPNIAGSSYRDYVYTMRANFYNKKISKLQLKMLNTVEFETYFDNLIHEKSKKTAQLPIQLCKRCSTWLYGKSLIEEDDAAFAKTKKEKRDEFFRSDVEKKRKEVFSSEDIAKFYDAYKNRLSEYCPAIILMLETFIRGQELLSLTESDIDLEKNIIHIRCAVGERFIDNDKNKGLEKYVKVPKSGGERIIYMTPLAREVVEFMMAQTKLKCRANPMNLLFPSYLKQGKMRSMDAFEVQFKALCDKLGIDRDVRIMKNGNKKGLCVHALRHTGITIANTVPNANVVNTALMAGHKAIKTENIYTHSIVEGLKNVRTMSDVVLHLNGEQEEEKSDKEKELYELYLMLKEKFGDDLAN